MACGQAEERVLLTGLHAVADIYCESCKTPLGWKYVSNSETKSTGGYEGSMLRDSNYFDCVVAGI